EPYHLTSGPIMCDTYTDGVDMRTSGATMPDESHDPQKVGPGPTLEPAGRTVSTQLVSRSWPPAAQIAVATSSTSRRFAIRSSRARSAAARRRCSARARLARGGSSPANLGPDLRG